MHIAIDPFVAIGMDVVRVLSEREVALSVEVLLSKVEDAEYRVLLSHDDDETKEEELDDTDAVSDVDVADDCNDRLDEGMTTVGYGWLNTI